MVAGLLSNKSPTYLLTLSLWTYLRFMFIAYVATLWIMRLGTVRGITNESQGALRLCAPQVRPRLVDKLMLHSWRERTVLICCNPSKVVIFMFVVSYHLDIVFLIDISINRHYKLEMQVATVNYKQLWCYTALWSLFFIIHPSTKKNACMKYLVITSSISAKNALVRTNILPKKNNKKTTRIFIEVTW